MGDLSVATVRRATADEWDRAVDASDAATYFHTRGWARVWARYTRGKLRPAAWTARFSDGASAVLPSSERTLLDVPLLGRYLPPLRTTISSNGAAYGGWVSAGPLSEQHHRLLWEHSARRNVQINQNPFDTGLRAAGLPWTEQEFTQVVDLRRPEQECRRDWARGHVSAVNKARRAGLVADRARDAARWREFFTIYRDSAARWGDPPDMFDERMFAILRTQDPEAVRLWVVSHPDGPILAGAICLYHRRTIMYWLGAFRHDQQHLRAAPFLHAEIMNDGRAGGFWWYDFNPSGSIPGVVTFKERFGAHRLPANTVIRRAPLKRRLAALRDGLPGRG